ncbi:MAG: DNA polymerase I [Clostridia bacterium]|nr:DNA polymerase I [Clostridia bacterium]
MHKLVLIDGNSLLNRAYFALPPTNDNQGRNVNAVYGFVNLLLKVLTDYQPTNLAVTFDKRGDNFRKALYPDYKANRKGMPDDLAEQMPILQNLLTTMGIKVVQSAGIEADDLIGSLAAKFGVPTLIVSGDKDLFQLVNDTTTVLLTKKGITEVETVTPQSLLSGYGLTPLQVVEYKALRGDTSDNIPGVRGVGEKTATALIQKYGDIETLYQNVNNEKGALKDKLIADRDMAFVSKQLATIVTNVPLDVALSDCVLPAYTNAVKQQLQALQFRSILSRLTFVEDEGSQPTQQTILEVEDVEITTADSFSTAVQYLLARPLVAFAYVDGVVYLSDSPTKQYHARLGDSFLDELTPQFVFDTLKPLFEGNTGKIVFDSKALRHQLDQFNQDLAAVKYDVALMQYLVEQRPYKTLTELLDAHGKQHVGAGLYQMATFYLQRLRDEQTDKLYFDVELPLAGLLYRMEKQGVKVDEDALAQTSAQLKGQIEQLTHQIYDQAGEVFNVSSPQQLSTVLFEKLGLKHFQKTSRGYSTKNDVLEKLRGEHPIVELIIQYRKLTKLQGTYVEGLKPLLKRGVVHTTYNQYLTTTGRLSSSDPNLQNIPIRNEQGKEIRKLFVSQLGKFVGADYSQIELRMLAGFSQDANLIAAFNEDKDIHTLVASELLGIAPQMVNSNMRRMAKAVNFGIIYGISSFGLSENTGLSVKKAQEYINLYFERFPTIKRYLDSCVEGARTNGYVSTITGRRRYIPEISSSNYNLRSFGERASMNMPLQGSAADVMKIAMLRVDEQIAKKGLQSKVVMQIHDEIIVDCPLDEVDAVKQILLEQMPNALDVGCKLTVELGEGSNLYEV